MNENNKSELNKEEVEVMCKTFTENVDRLCKTIEKVDKHKTIQSVSFLIFGIIAIIALTTIIICPIG